MSLTSFSKHLLTIGVRAMGHYSHLGMLSWSSLVEGLMDVLKQAGTTDRVWEWISMNTDTCSKDTPGDAIWASSLGGIYSHDGLAHIDHGHRKHSDIISSMQSLWGAVLSHPHASGVSIKLQFHLATVPALGCLYCVTEGVVPRFLVGVYIYCFGQENMLEGVLCLDVF